MKITHVMATAFYLSSSSIPILLLLLLLLVYVTLEKNDN